MSEPRSPSRLARSLRRLEHLMGAHRDDRTLWVWVGPFSTLVLTFATLVFFGHISKVDLGLTLPMAATMGLLMGALSAFYMSASSADEADEWEDEATPPPPQPVPAPAATVDAPAPRPAPLEVPVSATRPDPVVLPDREPATVGSLRR